MGSLGLKITVIQNGKLREAAAVAWRDEYLTRFRRFGTLSVIERTPKAGAGLWPEGARWKVLLDERGETPDSKAFAKLIDTWMTRHGEITFAIGAAEGHDPATIAGASARLSLSAMTLPHQMAHVVLVEQLYRAATILAGLPYHKE